jgi:hypothetical protein
MLLLETAQGKSWLEQFHEQDREMAALLVNSLQLISLDKFEKGITSLVKSINTDKSTLIALYCIRETKPGEHYFDIASRDSLPLMIPSGKEVGSEGRVAHIITNLCRETGNRFLNHPSLEDLRYRECHTIALLDDLSGSGNRVNKFLRSFYSHPSIKSWYSYRKIQIHIVCYAASETARKNVKKTLRRTPKFHFRENAFSGTSRWSKDDFESLCELCKKYGRRTRKTSMSLGYNNTMGTMVFAHSCPNNVPAILWAKSAKWAPLFPNRVVSSELAPLFGELDASMRKYRQELLFGSAGFRSGGSTLLPDTELRNVLLVMTAVKKRNRESDLISQAVDLDKAETERILTLCQRAGLLTDTLRFTPKANRFFRKSRDTDMFGISINRFDNSFYFPYGGG